MSKVNHNKTFSAVLATSLLAFVASANASNQHEKLEDGWLVFSTGQITNLANHTPEETSTALNDLYDSLPKQIGRGDLTALKESTSTELSVNGKSFTFKIPGSESQNTQEANDAVRTFREGKFPRDNIGAYLYWTAYGKNDPNGKYEFNYLHLLDDKKLYVENGKIVGVIASYGYWGCKSSESAEYDLNEMSKVLIPLAQEHTQLLNNPNFLKHLDGNPFMELSEIYQHNNTKYGKLFSSYDGNQANILKTCVTTEHARSVFNELATKNSILVDGHECMVAGSRKEFVKNLPNSAAVVSAYINRKLRLGDLNVEFNHNDKALGVKAVYQYRGRLPYSLTYENHELPVFFKFTDEEAKAFSKPVPVKAATEDKEERPIRVLSLDGGGTRGVGTAQCLNIIGQRVKEKYNQELHEYFDLIVGTSTGGILAGAIGLGVTSDKLVDIYLKDSKEIFKGNGIVGLYDHNDLKTVLKKYVTEAGYKQIPLMSETKTRIAVTAYEQKENRNVLLTNEMPSKQVDFKTDDVIPAGNVSIFKILRCTSSAPTYFKGVKLAEGVIESQLLKNQGNIHEYSDGGVTTNNPTQKAYNYVKHLKKEGVFDRKRRIKMLSLGTGEMVHDGYATDTGVFGFLKSSGIKHLSEGAQRNAAQEAEKTIKNDEEVDFYRFNFKLNEAVDLASKDEKILQGLINQANARIVESDFYEMLNKL